MAKRQYSGQSTVNPQCSYSGAYGKCRGQYQQQTTKMYRNFDRLAKIATGYFWTAFSVLEVNYLAICTLFAVLVLSFLLPDFSQKMQVSNEMKEMQKVLDIMSQEVNRAEVACLTAADEICCLHCSVRDDTTETSADVQDLSVCTSSSMRSTRSEPVQVEKKIGFLRRIFFPNKNASYKEIAIMSYVYTNSFDAKKPMNATTMTPEII